jgi:excisionase family DNA binding protein
MEMAMGFAMAQQMMQGMAAPGAQPSGGAFAAAAPGTPPAAGPSIPELLGPADAARVMGVSEADVIATIESGDLKAKKIGSQFRITRAALDEFLKS